MKEKSIDILNHMILIISSGWCKGSAAQFADGTPCGADHPWACRWCLTAALDLAVDTQIKSGPDQRARIWHITYNHLLRNSDTRARLDRWNDRNGVTRKDVLNLIVKTVENIKKEGENNGNAEKAGHTAD